MIRMVVVATDSVVVRHLQSSLPQFRTQIIDIRAVLSIAVVVVAAGMGLAVPVC